MSDALDTQKHGVEVVGVIIDRPNCGKINKIRVSYLGSVYKLSVPKNSCINGEYVRGENISVKYNSKIDHMILDTSYLNTQIGYYLSIVCFLIPIFFLVLLIRPIGQ